MSSKDTHVNFPGNGLNIEGILNIPDGLSRVPAAIICHPHPRYGGDMHNNVVSTVANSLESKSIATLRFNFRGVGRSEGQYDDGVGESDDTLAALDFLSLFDEIDTSRIGIVGYSFGASVALNVASQNDILAAIASISCPSRAFGKMAVEEILLPKLLICGEYDHDFPEDRFVFFAKRYTDPKEIAIIEDADHFFAGQLEALGETVADFFARRLSTT